MSNIQYLVIMRMDELDSNDVVVGSMYYPFEFELDQPLNYLRSQSKYAKETEGTIVEEEATKKFETFKSRQNFPIYPNTARVTTQIERIYATPKPFGINNSARNRWVSVVELLDTRGNVAPTTIPVAQSIPNIQQKPALVASQEVEELINNFLHHRSYYATTIGQWFPDRVREFALAGWGISQLWYSYKNGGTYKLRLTLPSHISGYEKRSEIVDDVVSIVGNNWSGIRFTKSGIYLQVTEGQ